MLFVAQEIKNLVVVDHAPIGKPDLPAGQGKGNRSGAKHDHQSRRPATASERDTSNASNS
jgi:hypothetical protein